jgi:hypothetical protein
VLLCSMITCGCDRCRVGHVYKISFLKIGES